MTSKAEPQLFRAQSQAGKLLEALGIEDPRDVELEDIAMHLGINVAEGSLKGAEARLLRWGNKGIIRVRSDIREPGRRRFAIGHEIGHWCLHEDNSQIETCLSGDLHGYTGSHHEIESNVFAAELLMPRPLLRKRYGNTERTLDLVSQVASEMNTTFTATALRLVETSQDPCLVVFSKNDIVQWWHRSKKARDIWLERKQRIDHDSTAYAAAMGASPTVRPVPVRPEAWFGHLRDCSRLQVQEQSILQPAYDTVVTLISYLEKDDEW
jgi:hypothetical protein